MERYRTVNEIVDKLEDDQRRLVAKNVRMARAIRRNCGGKSRVVDGTSFLLFLECVCNGSQIRFVCS